MIFDILCFCIFTGPETAKFGRFFKIWWNLALPGPIKIQKHKIAKILLSTGPDPSSGRTMVGYPTHHCSNMLILIIRSNLHLSYNTWIDDISNNTFKPFPLLVWQESAIYWGRRRGWQIVKGMDGSRVQIFILLVEPILKFGFCGYYSVTSLELDGWGCKFRGSNNPTGMMKNSDKYAHNLPKIPTIPTFLRQTSDNKVKIS